MKATKEFDLIRTRPLPRSFSDRDPRRVARDLLGKVLVRRERGHLLAGRIVEVEAYLGSNDAAAHAAAGRTARNFVLWGPPGHAYVYFIYGNYFCLNVSCLPAGRAGCILVRALEPMAGMQQMSRARGLRRRAQSASELRRLTSGPGRLAEAFGITRRRDNDKDVTSLESDLQIVNDGFHPRGVLRTPRIGLTKAAEHPLRYVIAGNPFVSGPKRLTAKDAKGR